MNFLRPIHLHGTVCFNFRSSHVLVLDNKNLLHVHVHVDQSTLIVSALHKCKQDQSRFCPYSNQFKALVQTVPLGTLTHLHLHAFCLQGFFQDFVWKDLKVLHNGGKCSPAPLPNEKLAYSRFHLHIENLLRGGRGA